MQEVPAATIKKIQTLAQIAADLCQGKDFNITRLTILKSVLHPWASSDLGYRMARQYAERYNSRYFNSLIPKSAPMVEDIAEFWGKYFLDRGWKKRLVK